MLARLIVALLKGTLAVLEKAFDITRKKSTPLFPYDENTNTISLPSEIEKEIRRLISGGNRIEAIKRVSGLTGAGLRLSKDYVDSLTKTGGDRQ